MKKFTTLLATLTLLLAPAWVSAKDFEGTLRIRMSGDGANQEANYSIKPGFMRLDLQAEGQSMATIVDLNKMESIMIMPAQQIYMVMSLKNAAAQAANGADDATIENTGITEKILGYTCTKYLIKSKGDITELWATEELGTFVNVSTLSSLNQRKGKVQAAWESVLKGKNLFPLRVVGLKANGKANFRMEILAVEQKSLPASLFQPPAGFQRMDMGGMMQGLMGGPR